MVDTRTPEQRSRIMRSVGTKDTGPEIIVRRLLHSEGYRFSLHRRDLPGSPDVVLPKHSKIIFVHGCFWHGHSCRRGARPKVNLGFWEQKLARNVARDRKVNQTLRAHGFRVLTVWQCALDNPDRLRERLAHFLKVRSD